MENIIDKDNNLVANKVLNEFYKICYKNLSDSRRGLIELCNKNTKAYWDNECVKLVIDCSNIDVHQYEEIRLLFSDDNIHKIRLEIQKLNIPWKLEYVPAKDYRCI